MHLVYRNAILNISAAAARDGNDGLFIQRDVNAVWPLPRCPRIETPDDEKSLVCPLAIENNLEMVDRSFWQRIFESSPIFGRAWIVQERLLARRILHFGTTQVFWECLTEDCCETFPDGIPLPTKASTSFLLKQAYHRLKMGNNDKSFTGERFSHLATDSELLRFTILWAVVVTDYTRCTLTYSSDKLIAIAGLAQDILNEFRDRIAIPVEYLAGIWSTHFLAMLLWKTSCIDSRPPEYRAPSWSWASINGTITWDDAIWKQGFSYAATVKEIKLTHAQDQWGQVFGGYLVIHGRLCRLKWDVPAPYKVNVTPSDPISSVLLHSRARWVELLMDELPDIKVDRWSDLYGLLILQFHDSIVRSHHILVLNSIPHTRNLFHRVGIVSPCTRKETEKWFSEASDCTIVII
jgi:hypothetical protein